MEGGQVFLGLPSDFQIILGGREPSRKLERDK